MPPRQPAPAPSTDLWEGRVIQSMRKENHVSIALDLGPADVEALGLQHGTRLRISAGGHEAEVFFHGWAKAWAMHGTFFGREAAAALAASPGIEAYLESDRVIGGTAEPGHPQWLRVRLALQHTGAEPGLFSVAEGSHVRLQVLDRSAAPAPVAAARFKQGVLQATVLASHPHALALNVTFAGLRKLGDPSDAWYLLEANGRQLPIHGRQGILPLEYERYYARPDALLFDFVAHWAHETTQVMLLKPMQTNFMGRFPDYASYTIPLQLAPGSTVTLRMEAAPAEG